MEVAAQNGLNNNGMPGPLAAVAEDQGNFTSDDVTPPPAVPVPPANGDVPDNGPNPLDLINPQQFLNLVNGGNIPLPDDAVRILSAADINNSFRLIAHLSIVTLPRRIQWISRILRFLLSARKRSRTFCTIIDFAMEGGTRSPLRR